MKKRRFIHLFFLPLLGWLLFEIPLHAGAINRFDLVTRHNPRLETVDFMSPFSLGNGEFAFTADVTGLQSFPEDYYNGGMPTEILSNWAWHSTPNPGHYRLEDAFEFIDTHGKKIGYPTIQNSAAGKWLRANPHRLPLGRVGFRFTKRDGKTARLEDIRDIHQKLDLWTGILESAYTVDGEFVRVLTSCHPGQDLIAVRVESPLVAEGRLSVELAFAYTYDLAVKNKPALDWSHPEAHASRTVLQKPGRAVIERTIDSSFYSVSVSWKKGGELITEGPHRMSLIPAKNRTPFEMTVHFSPTAPSKSDPDVRAVMGQSRLFWRKFWESGGAIDLSGSTDPRAHELERRIILSQYLTRIQCAGAMPPQESGLTHISWFGKHHTEMTWWHTAHFALWGRTQLLENSLAWFAKILPYTVQATRSERQCGGARWSKMTGPEGRESPGGNPFIIWNQPHPIFLAELCYRSKPLPETLEKYKDVVLQSAEYMAEFAFRGASEKRYVLGPPVWLAQEIYEQRTAQNPAFELSYWVTGLKLAQAWRERMGMPRDPVWEDVLSGMSRLPVRGGLYVGLESTPDTFTNPESMRDHPSMLMACGFLPGDGVDREIMKRTLSKVLDGWHWEEKIWGWDYPMIAMTAARLAEPEKAVDMLLADLPHNHYLNNGHCPGTPDLPVYLPANGALLAASAMMAAGWDDGPATDAPGFPKNGKWKVKWEGLRKMP
jgi:hypothetical protein